MFNNIFNYLNNKFSAKLNFTMTRRLRRLFWYTANFLHQHGVSENILFMINLSLIFLGLNFLALQYYYWALFCLIFWRIIRIIAIFMKQHSQFFFIYAGDFILPAVFLLGFALANPAQNAVAVSCLLATLLIASSSVLFLAIHSCNVGNFRCLKWKSYFNSVLFSNNVIFYLLFAMCLFYNYFLFLSLFFSLLSLIKILLMFSSAFYILEIKNIKD